MYKTAMESGTLTKADIKRLRDLRDRSGREASGWHLLEGPRLVQEAHDTGHLLSVYVDRRERQVLWKERVTCPVHLLSDIDFERISTVGTSQGVFGIGPLFPRVPFPVLLRSHDRLVLLDGVQDPGNVGTLARTACALGVTGLLLRGPTADPDGQKVLRASAGALLRMEIGICEEESLAEIHTAGHQVIVPVVRGGHDLRTLERFPRFILVAGNEGQGSSLVHPQAIPTTIPMAAKMESLNVAAAAAIILAHLCL